MERERDGERERERERENMVIEIISLLLTMAALQIKNLNVIVQNCYINRNDRCLGTFWFSSLNLDWPDTNPQPRDDEASILSLYYHRSSFNSYLNYVCSRV